MGDECQSDMDCRRGHKCCRYEANTCAVCKKAVFGPKPRPCKRRRGGFYCDAIECQSHKDCPDGEICCVNQCDSHVCRPANETRVCPPISESDCHNYEQECYEDS